MSADNLDDWDSAEVEPSRDASREPGLDAAYDKAFGELAAENAELYKRIDYLESALKTERARHDAWAREMDWREEVMRSRIERLEHTTAIRPTSPEVGAQGRRVGETGTFDGERDGRPRKARPSDQFVAMGAAVGVEAVAAVLDPSTPNLVIGAIGVLGAGIPWIRKLREDRLADRP